MSRASIKHASEVSLDTPSAIADSMSARFRLPLRRFFGRYGIPRDDIEDMVQEVFLRMAGRPGIESMERLGGYLFTTAANLLRDRHRRREAQTREAHEPFYDGVHGIAPDAYTPDHTVLGTQIVDQLLQSLLELPERTQVIFSLCHFEELSHAEIGRRLGIAVSTIEKHIGRANAHLLEALDAI